MLPASEYCYEQGYTLAQLLQEAGLEHGDEAEVKLEGVGVQEGRLCFCPAYISVVPMSIRRGSRRERRQPIPDEVQFSWRSRLRICTTLRRRYGFANVSARVITNGAIHLNALQILNFQSAPAYLKVNHTSSYREFCTAVGAR